MKIIKILLVGFGLILLGMLAFPIIAFVYHALWYLFWIAVLGLTGYVGYKVLTRKKDSLLLEDKSSFALPGLDSADRAFREFRRKHLTK
ncbi:MAG: hypothetical protein JSS81_15245 [Acidobacteria bacterium]|nr:hypothetical protein [Acidobacteriota bacterium]